MESVMTGKTMRDDLIEFNQQLPMIEERWFKLDPGCDHGFIHVGGLDEHNLKNDGMYLSKTAELIQALLHALHGQIIEVKGDAIDYKDAMLLHGCLRSIRTDFSRVAEIICKSRC